MYVIYGSKVANSSQLGSVHMWSRERSNDQNQMKIMQVLATGVYGLKHHRLSSCVIQWKDAIHNMFSYLLYDRYGPLTRQLI